MAQKGVGYFDSKGHFFKHPDEATISDLASLLGQIGEGDSLAPGIAHMLLEKRAQVEQIFAEHDAMIEGLPDTIADDPKIAILADRKEPETEQTG